MNDRRVEVLALQNDDLAFTWYSDASMEVRAKQTGAQWLAGPVAIQELGSADAGHVWLRNERSQCEQYPARFAVRAEGDTFRVSVFDQLGQSVGDLRCRWTLEGPWLRFTLLAADESLPSLIFPTPFFANSLVVPQGIGRWYRKPLSSRYLHRFGTLSMRWFGGLAEGDDNGYLAVFTDRHQDAGISMHQSCISPLWLKSLGQWSGPRTISYRFTSGGYVGLAREYRQWAMDNRLHVPLVEKIRRCPKVAHLLGGRELLFFLARTFARSRYEDTLQPEPPELRGADSQRVQVDFTYAQVQQAIAEARQLGWKRGSTKLCGWIAGGYDETHPDVWPPLPELGSVAELRDLCSLDGEYLGGLHDNYGDIYAQSASFPRGVNRGPDGLLMRGGWWSGGQCYIVNARNQVEYARRNWEHLQTLNVGKLYSDTISAVYFYESFEQGNTLTRSQDEAYKQELMAFFKSKGVVLASEESSDFAVPYLDCADGEHSRSVSPEWVTVPLWPLVFHDAILCGRHGSGPGCKASGGSAPWWLPLMLWGYYGIWQQPKTPSPAWKEEFARTFFMEEWHARVGLADLVNHRFLTDDFQVEQTQFSNGLVFTANFAGEPRTVEGKTIPAGDYLIEESLPASSTGCAKAASRCLGRQRVAVAAAVRVI